MVKTFYPIQTSFSILDYFCQSTTFDYNSRKSLVCDLEEPFRPIIDAALIKALNLEQINEKDFWKNQKQFILPWKNAAPYVEIFIKAIMEYKNEIFIYLQSYYRAFVQKKNAEDFPFFDLDDTEES